MNVKIFNKEKQIISSDSKLMRSDIKDLFTYLKEGKIKKDSNLDDLFLLKCISDTQNSDNIKFDDNFIYFKKGTVSQFVITRPPNSVTKFLFIDIDFKDDIIPLEKVNHVIDLVMDINHAFITKKSFSRKGFHLIYKMDSDVLLNEPASLKRNLEKIAIEILKELSHLINFNLLEKDDKGYMFFDTSAFTSKRVCNTEACMDESDWVFNTMSKEYKCDYYFEIEKEELEQIDSQSVESICDWDMPQNYETGAHNKIYSIITKLIKNGHTIENFFTHYKNEIEAGYTPTRELRDKLTTWEAYIKRLSYYVSKENSGEIIKWFEMDKNRIVVNNKLIFDLIDQKFEIKKAEGILYIRDKNTQFFKELKEIELNNKIVYGDIANYLFNKLNVKEWQLELRAALDSVIHKILLLSYTDNNIKMEEMVASDTIDSSIIWFISEGKPLILRVSADGFETVNNINILWNEEKIKRFKNFKFDYNYDWKKWSALPYFENFTADYKSWRLILGYLSHKYTSRDNRIVLITDGNNEKGSASGGGTGKTTIRDYFALLNNLDMGSNKNSQFGHSNFNETTEIYMIDDLADDFKISDGTIREIVSGKLKVEKKGKDIKYLPSRKTIFTSNYNVDSMIREHDADGRRYIRVHASGFFNPKNTIVDVLGYYMWDDICLNNNEWVNGYIHFYIDNLIQYFKWVKENKTLIPNGIYKEEDVVLKAHADYLQSDFAMLYSKLISYIEENIVLYNEFDISTTGFFQTDNTWGGRPPYKKASQMIENYLTLLQNKKKLQFESVYKRNVKLYRIKIKKEEHNLC